LILGVTYRGDVKETAFSGAFGAKRELERLGATALAADPLYSSAELRELGFEPWDGGPVDAAIIQADHRGYRELTPRDVPGVAAILDGRGVLDAATWRESGIDVLLLGAP
jgi:UDP-N-acetyl-D-mannosaminuronic acid dehydrogenase